MIVTPSAGYNQALAVFGGIRFSDTEGRLGISGETEDSANSQTSNLARFGNLLVAATPTLEHRGLEGCGFV